MAAPAYSPSQQGDVSARDCQCFGSRLPVVWCALARAHSPSMTREAVYWIGKRISAPAYANSCSRVNTVLKRLRQEMDEHKPQPLWAMDLTDENEWHWQTFVHYLPRDARHHLVGPGIWRMEIRAFPDKDWPLYVCPAFFLWGGGGAE